MAKRLSGKVVSDDMMKELTGRIAACREAGVQPALAVLRVGESDADLSYEKGIRKRCDMLGIVVRRTVLAENCTQEELLGAVDQANIDPQIHGILLFRPLPKHLDEREVMQHILPAKDVDAVTMLSAAGLYMGDPNAFAPCTAEAVMRILHYYDIPCAGKRAVVIGRSAVIGRPVSLLLLGENATVTICHSYSQDLPAIVREADIIVAAAGKREMIGKDHLRAGQVVLDVGIHAREDGTLCGDVNYPEAEELAAAVTPVPGGVGAVTTAVLLEHVVRVAESRV